MRITKQPSRGRGELELCDYAPNGLGPNDVIGVPIHLRLGTFTFATHVHTTTQGNKYRLRLISGGEFPQVHIQVANLLLMPDPTRDETKLGAGEPVLQQDAYLVKNINFGDVSYEPGDKFLMADVLTIDCANNSIQAQQIAAQQRMAEVEKIWNSRGNFPTEVADLLGQHERLVHTGHPIPKDASKLVAALQAKMSEYSDELGVFCTRATDVVPAFLAVLDSPTETVPISVDQIEPEFVEVRRREIKKWRQYASRGFQGVLFRRKVRKAYDSRCLMCGGRFPSTPYNGSPGIDAAHILPWSEFELDKVYNGIALCKLHHWAFDEGLLVIVFREGKYFVELSEDAQRNLTSPDFSVDLLQQVVGEIPAERLPKAQMDWPNPGLLERFYAVSQ